MRVIGISPSHDSSVAVINDGKLEFFFKEERISGKKRDEAPYLSLIEAFYNIKGKVDFCVFASPSTGLWEQSATELIKKLFGCEIVSMNEKHHLQHAALAFENSNFEKCLVFVIDRNGSYVNSVMRESETVFICNKDDYSFKPIYKNFWAIDLGSKSSLKVNDSLKKLGELNPDCEFICKSSFNTTKVYETATSLISQDPLENGKTMGLSSYGNPNKKYEDFFSKEFTPIDHYFSHDFKDFAPNISVSINVDLDKFTTKDISEDNFQIYADYALHVQNQTQTNICNLIKKYVEKTGINNVVVTGGYGMNIVSNSFYVQQLRDVNFYFEPLADDCGNSIGSAIYFYKKETKDFKNYGLKSTFFHGLSPDYSNIIGKKCFEDDIIQIILDQKSVGIYGGLSESGQRSLGNRSIIFDATNENAREIVNDIKKREWYRPFAAVCLEEDCDKYFDMLGLPKSEFMTNSFTVRDEYKNLLKGVLHVDDTCRLQTVTEGNILYKLLCGMKKNNRIPILLNTSFNLAGYPLVETPQNAIDTLHKSSLDCIWFYECNLLIEK